MQRGAALTINVVGGVAVLGSYAHGLITHPGQSDLLWGALPANLQTLYTGMMIPAALGYLTFTAYLLFAKAEDLTLFGNPAMPLINANYAVFLVTAALWMPLCWIALDGSAQWLFFPIRSVLALTGLAALGFIVILWKVEGPPRPSF